MKKQAKSRLGAIALRGGALVVLILGVLAVPRNARAQGDVIITEVAFKETEGSDWAEIYNTSASAVDISGYKLTDLDGDDTVFASSATTLGAREHAVIHWIASDAPEPDETDAEGDLNRNGYIDLYVKDGDPTGTDDQLVLVNGAGVYIDAVIWSNGNGGGSEYEFDDFNALAPDEWDYADVANWTEYDSRSWTDSDAILAGESLARDIANGYVDTNRIDDWYEETDPVPGKANAPTAATLARFEAAPREGAILVEWETVIEVDSVGFNLYRSESPGGPYLKLNEVLIPSQAFGAVEGAVYTWRDEDVEPGLAYSYKLEDVEVGGARTFHGPMSASVQNPMAVTLASFTVQRRAVPVALLAAALIGGSALAFHWRRKSSRFPNRAVGKPHLLEQG